MLTICSECRRQLPSDALACPSCSKRSHRPRLLVAVITGLLIGLLFIGYLFWEVERDIEYYERMGRDAERELQDKR